RRDMLAHGFTVDFLVDLRTGMATTRTERVVAGGRAMEVARVRITKVGRRGTRGASMALIPQACLASRPSGECNDDDYNVRGYGHHYDRSPTHDYEPTVELATDAA